ncbi:MAG: AI-2E family transporter [Agriterribacter sp.]
MNIYTRQQKNTIVSKYLLIVFIACLLLYFGRTLFIPLFFGLLIAIVMYPISSWLEKKKFPRSVAVSICLLIVTVLFVALVSLVIWQLKIFQKDSKALLLKIHETLDAFTQWLQQNAGVKIDFRNDLQLSAGNNIGGILQSILGETMTMLFIVFMVPVFTALFMYHRNRLVQCLRMITPVEERARLTAILRQVTHTYFQYIKGMLIVYLLVGILNTIGLWALGVPSPLLFGMVCAIMTIIPYIGIIISSLLPISLIWLQTDSIIYPLAVIAVFAFVQYLEANVIFPRVVGTQLNVSTLAMLVAIIAGGIIWGGAGMVLFIPFVGMLKIVTDQVPEWAHINLLLRR